MADDADRIEIALPYVDDAEWEAARGCFASGWLTQGPNVAAFEDRFAERHGVSHAVATTSCTTALHLALASCDIGPGDEVIVPGFTWVATPNVVRYCGATPRFVDVDPVTFNLAPELVENAVNERTRAVIAVHLFGLCADVPAIRSTLPAGVVLVEDAACAAGASWDGRPAGSLGDVGAFSFHPRKVITTGEGGMLTTSDDGLAERARRARNHGASVSEEARHAGPQPFLLPDFDELGFNYRMTDMQGAVGIAQLGRLDPLVERRRAIAAAYDAGLSDLDWISTPEVSVKAGHTYQSYVCVVDETRAPKRRNQMMADLLDLGISTRPGTHAPPELGLYREALADCPVSRELAQTTMAIPMHNRLSESDVERVIDAIHTL